MSTVFEVRDNNDRREQLVKKLEVYTDSDWACEQTTQSYCRHTQTDTDRHTQRHTHTDTHTQTYTDIHRHTHTHLDTHRHTDTDMDTHTVSNASQFFGTLEPT